jgi:D-glycero-D-manno-heptose 1,7-bisphosphate phosphatase
MNRAVFLDRDGVINKACIVSGEPATPKKAEDFEILPGVKEALTALKAKGYRLFVATNQPDIRRGTLTVEELEKMHEAAVKALPIDGIYVCMHDNEDDCDCRKPKPGMLLRAAKEWDIDLGASYMIGDRWKDIEAGQAVGCKTILIKSPFSRERPPGYTVESDYVAENLAEASRQILSME